MTCPFTVGVALLCTGALAGAKALDSLSRNGCMYDVYARPIPSIPSLRRSAVRYPKKMMPRFRSGVSIKISWDGRAVLPLHIIYSTTHVSSLSLRTHTIVGYAEQFANHHCCCCCAQQYNKAFWLYVLYVRKLYLVAHRRSYPRSPRALFCIDSAARIIRRSPSPGLAVSAQDV